MTLTTGARLGPYEILGPLGAGGMGEVYRAKDTRLDRNVAIKVLSQHLSANPEGRARFEREARAVSSLSHPHICTLHDIGQHEGADYLVMELLEGETLSARIARGPLPAEELLRYAAQICDALDKAHRQGLVHRDLKPGNIMLTKSGAKLLDFGLAKAIGLAPGVTDLTSSPTVSRPLTAEGTIVGTFQYMPPEVLEGKEADARSDIFSFGAVLYEMATGQRAFEGKSQASVIASILKTDPPPISVVQPMAPPALERVVRSCLAKDPEDRWQTAHDLSLQLKWILEGGSQAGVAAPVATRRKTQQWAAWGAAAILFLTTVALGILYFRPAPPAESLRFIIPAPEKMNFRSSLAISPDGKSLAFTASTADGKSQIWLRPLDSLEARALPGTEEAAHPFWSPDSRTIAFFASGKLKKIDVLGGPAQTLCEAADGRGGTWNRDGVILFAPSPGAVLFRVSAAGGAPQGVTTLNKERSETSHRWPFFLPDGKHFLFAARATTTENEALLVGSLDGGAPVRLMSALSSLAYAPPGYLLFVREQALMAQPFDAKGLRLTGDAFPLAEKVELQGEAGPTGYAGFSVAANGTLVYQTDPAGQARQLVWLDRQGKRLNTTGPTGDLDEPALSGDGKRLAVEYKEQKAKSNDLWILEFARGSFSRFTSAATSEVTSAWAPDGNTIYFAANAVARFDLYRRSLTAGGSDEPVFTSPHNKWLDDISPDGKLLLFEDEDSKTKTDLWTIPAAPNSTPQPFLHTEFNEVHAHFSPDGHWVAYVSDETGRPEVYAQPFPGPGQKVQISTNGGDQPTWRRDGKELFFVAPDKRLMAVSVKLGAALDVGTPQALFEVHIRLEGVNGSRNQYVVAPDGQRFLVINLLDEGARAPLTVITNWSSAVRK